MTTASVSLDPIFQLEEELLRRELARRNFLDFITYTKPDFEVAPYHRELAEIIDAFVQAVQEKKSPRLMIWLPPGHSKSEFVSRRLPAYALARIPNLEWLGCTYNQEFASLLGRDVRRVVTDPAFTAVFPSFEVRKDSNAVDMFETSSGGRYTNLGVGGGTAGRRGHILAIDDPIKGKEQADSKTEREKLKNWYNSDFQTRIHPGAGKIIVQTRWSEDDLSGYLIDIAKQNDEAEKWMVYSFPAIAEHDEKFRKQGEALHPERFGLAELKKIRAAYEASDNLRDWFALYQQQPKPPEGVHYKREHVHYGTPPQNANLNHYITTDFAIGEKTTNDRTVLWPFSVDERGEIWYDVPIGGRFNAFDIVEKLCGLLSQRKVVQLALENVHISKTLGPYLKKRMQELRIYTPIWSFTATKDKLARGSSLRGRMQQGKVHFHPRCRPVIEDEFLPFPGCKFDDHQDAAVVGCLMLDQLLPAAGAPAPPPKAPPEWSMEWMKQRIRSSANSSRDENLHVPRTITGKPRKAVKR